MYLGNLHPGMSAPSHKAETRQSHLLIPEHKLLTPHHLHSYAFGWGRRFCPGSHIARNSLFITLSRLVWGIEFSAPLSLQTGRPIVPDIADEEATWSEGFVSTPNPFRVRFAARSARHAELIKEGFDSVQSEWRRMKLDVDQR